VAQKAADQVTLVDLTDGYSVHLEKYAHIFNGGASAAVAGSTTCKVTALAGPNTVACSVNLANVTAPNGVTVTKDSNAITPTLTITVSTAFNAPGFVTIPVEVDGIVIVQSLAVSFAKTGATGASGTSSTLVGLKNEAQMIPTDAAGATTGASTISVDSYGYVGATRTAVTASVGTLPDGITVGTNTAGTGSVDGVLTLNVASGASMGGATSGSIPVTLTCNGISREIPFSWAKAIPGAAGLAGTDGADALTVEIASSAGLVFKNSQVSTTLTASVYKGGVLQTAPQTAILGVIKWYKDGTYLSGKDGLTLTVSAGDVTDRATFEARLDGWSDR